MPPKRSTFDDSPATASHSRNSSSGSVLHAHAPATPSQLRQAHAPSDRSSSPEETMHHARYYDDDEPQHLGTSSSRNSEVSADGIQPASDGTSAQSVHEHALAQHDGIVEVDMEPTVRSRLLNHQNWDAASGCGDANCSHGDTSPRPGNPQEPQSRLREMRQTRPTRCWAMPLRMVTRTPQKGSR
jgi:hypothetical protein